MSSVIFIGLIRLILLKADSNLTEQITFCTASKSFKDCSLDVSSVSVKKEHQQFSRWPLLGDLCVGIATLLSFVVFVKIDNDLDECILIINNKILLIRN